MDNILNLLINNKIIEKKWEDNYSLFNSFYYDKIKVYEKNFNLEFSIKKITMGDLVNYEYLSYIINLFNQPLVEFQKVFNMWVPENLFDVLQIILFEINDIKELLYISKQMISFLNFIFEDQLDIDYNNRCVKVNNILIDENVWEYILYIVNNCLGNHKQKPKKRVYKTEAERLFFEKMQAQEERIRQIRQRGKSIDKNQNKQSSDEQLSTMAITILYALPNLDFDFLFRITLDQLSWLYTYALKIVNYRIEEKAYAAGNMKKKLKFFTEK